MGAVAPQRSLVGGAGAFLILCAAVVIGAWLITLTSAFAREPAALGAAIAIDLALALPAAYWALMVRTGRAPARTIVPIAALGALGASVILPGGAPWLRWIAAPAEISLVGWIAWKVRGTLREVGRGGDVLENATLALERALGMPRVARVVASEVAMLWCGLAPPRKRLTAQPRFPDAAREAASSVSVAFSPARSGIVLGVLGPMVVLETALVHLVVSMWSAGLAWALTGLSAYTLLWLVGDYRAIAARPILVEHDALVVRVGLRCTLRARWDEVALVRLAHWRDAGRVEGRLNLAGAAGANVLVDFARPVTARRMFGIEQRVTSVALAVEHASALVTAAGRMLADADSPTGQG